MCRIKIITLLLATSLLYTACNNKPAGKKENEKEDTAKASVIADTLKTPMPGSDRDEHGCIGSAGYTWSIIKKDCIRIFEIGIRLNPAAAVADKTTAAFIVFDNDKLKAELYIPGQPGASVILEYGKKNSQLWFYEIWDLIKTEKGFVLKKGGVVQYAE